MAKPNQTRPDPNQQPDHREEPPEYIPASPVKRTMAWIGIVYMVILLCLTTFYFYTGRMLGNLAPPAHRARAGRPGGADPGQLALHRPPPPGAGLWAEPAVLLSGRLHPAHRSFGSDEQFLRLYYERTDLLRPGGPGADRLRPP